MLAYSLLHQSERSKASSVLTDVICDSWTVTLLDSIASNATEPPVTSTFLYNMSCATYAPHYARLSAIASKLSWSLMCLSGGWRGALPRGDDGTVLPMLVARGGSPVSSR